MSTEHRLLRLENALSTLVELAQKADERMTRVEEAQVNIQSAQANIQEAQAKLQEAQALTENVLGRLVVVTTVGFKDLIEKVNIIADAQIKADERVSALVESQARADERLSLLIGVVERYFSDGRNGKP